jgi:phage host-nuclease inhibitor protein Gam
MAKRINAQTINLKSWDDVNEALRQIARINATIDKATAEYNLKRLELDKKLEEKTCAILGEKKTHEGAIELYCKKNRDQFDESRTKTFFYGLIKLRWLPPRLTTRAKFTWVRVMTELERLKMDEFIRIKKEPDKEKLKTLTLDKLLQVGLDVIQDEEFYYEAFNKESED